MAVLYKNLIVFGATGGVGSSVLNIAAQRGYRVTAAVRNLKKLQSASGITGVEVDVAHSQSIDSLIKQFGPEDAVLWCVGVNSTSSLNVGAKSLPLLVEAMRKQGMQRLVSISGSAISVDGDKRNPSAKLAALFVRRLLPALVADKQAEHRILKSSDLKFTEIRPPRMFGGPGKGRYDLRPNAPGFFEPPICKNDVALAMVDVLENDQWVRQSPFIGY